MKWKLDKNRPICPQIYEQVCLRIACGILKPNEKLLSVRETALELGVNPNTVQHAFDELEQQGVLYSVRGSGWYVSENLCLAKEIYNGILNDKTAAYFSEMEALGMTQSGIKKYVEEWRDE